MSIAMESHVAVSSGRLISLPPTLSGPPMNVGGELAPELLRLLALRNGFYAFESALHVFPAGHIEGVLDIETWNSEVLWRREFGSMADGCLFFAEDIFGGQFCIKDARVHSFD